jgi:hypothetical protein
MWTPEEEKLVLEDGGNILLEPEVNRMRLEPKADRISVQDFGGEMIYEDGDFIELEDATETFEEYYFTTERSMEPTGQRLVMEDGDILTSEDGDLFLLETGQENGVYSFAPLGTTLRSLNIITGQDTYRISKYLKDETDDDDILFEDGHGNILLEECVSEGLRISDLESDMPNFFIPQFEQRQRTRTNFTFSATVKSA